jgi:demethylmenaquinone methyltransferase/2-methoxy-6-polyprenyl-1,4-benzoquinol methylase
MSRPGNYAQQAQTYDYTRGASPTVVRAVAKHLGPAEGRPLLDIAGGTGNYAQVFSARGFPVVVVDASPEMLAHAARKLGPGRCVAGDAMALPIRDRAMDCAIMVNAFHLIEEPRRALREARRVIRAGPLVLTAFTEENLAALFVYEYFGLSAPLTPRPSAAETEAMLKEAGFSTVRSETYVYTDTVDGSLNALHTNALHLAGPAYLRNTSFWYGLDEETRTRGLRALADDLRSGRLAERVKAGFELALDHGHGTVFAAWP